MTLPATAPLKALEARPRLALRWRQEADHLERVSPRGEAGDGLGALLARRRLVLLVAAVAALQLILVLGGASGFPCPLREATSLPCPGCGLSRACVALLRGDVLESLRLHALAPVALVLLALLAACAVLPASARARLARGVASVQALRAIPLVALSIVIIYWLARLASGWRG